MTTYTISYAIKRLRDAVEYAEMTDDFAPLRKTVNDLEDSITAETDHDAELLREGRKEIGDYLEHEGYKEEDADIDSKDQEDTIKGILDSMHPY